MKIIERFKNSRLDCFCSINDRFVEFPSREIFCIIINIKIKATSFCKNKPKRKVIFQNPFFIL